MSEIPQQMEKLGPYRLLEKLGEGAAGAVYRAGHDILQREYAVKVVHRRLAANETFRQRFYREARLAARLEHPNIVNVVTADSDGDYYYLVMEYVDGHSLETLVNDQGPLPAVQAVCYVKRILEGIEYAHNQGMLHRDVKAENVLLSGDGEPKLADFGLVVDVNEGSDLTAQDAVVGTPYYMAPEQWRSSEDLDGRADVFATGVLLFYLLSGEFPYPGNSPLQVMYRLNKAPAEPLQISRWGDVDPRRRSHLDKRLTAIVDTSLQRRCEERYQSAARFRQALEGWMEQANKACGYDNKADAPKSTSRTKLSAPSSSPTSSLAESTATASDSTAAAVSDSQSTSGPGATSFSGVEPEDSSSTNTSFPNGGSSGAVFNAQGDEPMQQSDPDLTTDYVEIAENIYWVGKRPENEIFYANPYLRRFPGSGTGGDFNLLIDPGSSKDFAVVQSKVSQVVGSIKNVSSVFINHQDPDVGSSVGLMLGRYTPDAHVLCTEDTWRLVHYYNIPRKQFVPMEKYPNGMKLPTGDVILPVPSPFCHFVGAMMIYDPSTRVLFSGDLFGGLTDRDADGLYADESDWTGMRAFHQIYMPTQPAVQNAIDNIRRLDPPVEVIAPQHGRVIRGKYVQEFMDRLYNLPVGLDVLDDRNASDDELQAWTTVLERVLDIASTALGRHEVEEMLEADPNLSGHITFAEGRPTVENFGKTSVERATRLLCNNVPPATVNSIKYEVVYAAEELGLPTPRVELDEDGDGPGSDDSGDDASAQFDVA